MRILLLVAALSCCAPFLMAQSTDLMSVHKNFIDKMPNDLQTNACGPSSQSR